MTYALLAPPRISTVVCTLESLLAQPQSAPGGALRLGSGAMIRESGRCCIGAGHARVRPRTMGARPRAAAFGVVRPSEQPALGHGSAAVDSGGPILLYVSELFTPLGGSTAYQTDPAHRVRLGFRGRSLKRSINATTSRPWRRARGAPSASTNSPAASLPAEFLELVNVA